MCESGRFLPTMPAIYVPSSGPHDWQWLLAKPGLHWKHGRSAMALADAWEAAANWPVEVGAALDAAGFRGLEPLLALPEHQVPLPGGSTASQTDLFVLARRPQGSLVSLAVEGKVDEPFGEQTVAEWRSDGSAGKQERLAHLLDLLALPDDGRTGGLVYQLLHRAASALIEAERFRADDAVMLVHSFSPSRAHFDDFAAFAAALGGEPRGDGIVPAQTPGDIQLHVGWATGTPAPEKPDGRVGPRFERAVSLACKLHAGQYRKGTEIPYVAHLLAVASLVLEDGGTEDEAIAAVLHDAVEDQGGVPTRRRIEQEFGRTVARIVEGCSDTDVTPKPPWAERKEAYIVHLAHADPSILRVSLADKLHNARAILFDLQAVGPEVWSRFNADRHEVLRYYGALADTFETRDAGPMAAELRRTLELINALGA
jgi:hypothetical protein